VESGSNVTFAVTAIPEPLLYQWQFDGTNILEATNATYDIAGVGVGNVGEYQVLIRKPDRESAAIISEKAYLSVSTHSEVLGVITGGSLTSPINSFANNSDSSYCTITFDKVCKYTPFPSATYPNQLNHPFLTIATTGNPPGLATGIAIQKNIVPPPPLVTDCGSNNMTTATVTLQSGITYRVGIYCNSATGNSTYSSITWTWQYHQ
jgi:hypothetical protein